MAKTWALLLMARSMKAIFAAVPPETPVSISSKSTVLKPWRSAKERLSTSISRLRSPPEATLLSSCMAWPGLALKSKR
jgi:hypothetical protein